jgi:hypothetical protein
LKTTLTDEEMPLRRGGSMLEIIKMQLKEYIDRMDQSDEKFLKQILTIVKKHLKIRNTK